MAVIQNKRDTSTNWFIYNPTLEDGQLGFERNTRKFKLGDGSTPWNNLVYYAPQDAGSAVANSYNSVAALLADQASQVIGSLYRVSILKSNGLYNHVWVEKLATSTAAKTDYYGWGTVVESNSVKLDTGSTGVKATIENTSVNRTITGVKIQSATAASGGDCEIDVKVDNVSIFDNASLPQIYDGLSIATTGIIVNESWNNTSVLTIHLNSIGGVTEPTVTLVYEYDDDPELVETIDLNRPATFTATPAVDQIDLSFSAVTNASTYKILFHPGDFNWADACTAGYDGTSLTFSHISLAGGTHYYYDLVAEASGYNTSASKYADATALTGGFVLADLNPIGNYDLSDNASVTTVATKISQLNNLLGSMGNLVQATDANRPTYDDANDMAISIGSTMMTVDISSLLINNDSSIVEIYGVMSINTLVRQSIMSFYSNINASYTNNWQIENATSFRLFKGNGGSYDTAISGAVTALATGTKYIYKLSTYADVMSIDVGGRTFTLDSSKADVITHFIFSGDGIPPNTAYYGTKGNHNEVILFNKALSVSEETDLRAYLASKWGAV